MTTAEVAVTQSRIPQLDGLRGVAIVQVLIWHYFTKIPAPLDNTVVEPLKHLFSTTWSGVDLFFVLSGFLIGGILIDFRGSSNYFKTFYLRRACRILPLYFALLGTYGAFWHLANWHENQGLELLVNSELPFSSFLVFVQNFFMVTRSNFGPTWLSVTWSLSIEEQFYLVLPLVVLATPPRFVPILSVVCIVLAPLFRSIFVFELPDYWAGTFVLLPARMDTLFWGVLGAWLVRQTKTRSYIEEHLYFIYALFVVLGFGVLFLTFSNNGVISTVMCTWGYSLFGAFYLTTLLLCRFSKNKLVLALVTFRPLRGIGIISYFIYLFHMPIAGILHFLYHGQIPNHYSSAGIIATLCALVVLFSSAFLSWRIFEQPLINLGRKHQYFSSE
jgi:peptidoglycan/LPS O-acetylase OafA/YrhL